MKLFVVFLLIYLLAGLSSAQQNNNENGKKQATFVQEGKSADNSKTSGMEKNTIELKIRQDGTAKPRKNKVREMMGSARSSEAALKIEKRSVREQPSASELRQLTAEQGLPKKRTEK